jgi:DNA (cytosine-5)-methyltransferase 1
MSPTRATKRGETSSPKPSTRPKAPFLEFFAGSGLVTHALAKHFEAVWANDISEKKHEPSS